MSEIFKRALSLYAEDGDIETVRCYLDRLIMMGIIEEGAAEQIEYMLESEV